MCLAGPLAHRRRVLVLQEELGGAGVYSMDERLLWADIPEDQRHDIMPEIWDGHNIADFVDPDIDAKLRALEREEDAAAALAEAAVRASASAAVTWKCGVCVCRASAQIQQDRIGGIGVAQLHGCRVICGLERYICFSIMLALQLCVRDFV